MNILHLFMALFLIVVCVAFFAFLEYYAAEWLAWFKAYLYFRRRQGYTHRRAKIAAGASRFVYWAKEVVKQKNKH